MTEDTEDIVRILLVYGGVGSFLIWFLIDIIRFNIKRAKEEDARLRREVEEEEEMK